MQNTCRKLLSIIPLFLAIAGQASAQLLSPPFTRIERICDDRLDNDGDGSKDCRDADCTASPACIDADGDKYPVSKDCNDFDANIHPGATESCNGIDDDCDMLFDDADTAVIGQRPWYADGDGDTYGDPLVSQTACNRPASYILRQGDCDDTNALAYTGATESCTDDVDNECDGTADCDDSDCTAELSCKSPWPMFHGNAQHTGESPYNGPRTATVKWSYKLSEITTGGTSGGYGAPKNFVIDSENRVFANASYTVIAFDGDSDNDEGTVLWSKSLGAGGSVALSNDESVLYAVADSDLYALDVDTGEEVWAEPFTDPTLFCYGEILVAKDGTIYVGSWDTYIYAVNPNGSLKWKTPTDGSIAPLASPTLSPDESLLYVGSGDPNYDAGGTLYALSTADGSVTWQQRINNNRSSGAIVDAEGYVYVSGMFAAVAKFTSAGDKQVWRSDEWTSGALTPGLYSGGIVYSGTAAGIVYAIDSATGETKWSYQTGANPDPDPDNPKDPTYGVLTAPVIGADGVLYIGAMDDVMYAFTADSPADSATNKEPLWKYKTGENIDENCPAIGADGTLYFSSGDGYIYAIRDE